MFFLSVRLVNKVNYRSKTGKIEEKILITNKKKTEKNEGFETEIEKACLGLFFLSETDAAMLPFFGDKVLGSPLEAIVMERGSTDKKEIEEREFVEFFARLTKIQDWFTPVEIRNAKRFLKLQKLLEDNLDDLTVVRAGRIQIDIYVVGIDRDGNLAGIRTKAVET